MKFFHTLWVISTCMLCLSAWWLSMEHSLLNISIKKEASGWKRKESLHFKMMLILSHKPTKDRKSKIENYSLSLTHVVGEHTIKWMKCQSKGMLLRWNNIISCLCVGNSGSDYENCYTQMFYMVKNVFSFHFAWEMKQGWQFHFLLLLH